MRNYMINVLSSYTQWIMSNYQAIVAVNNAVFPFRLISVEQNSEAADIRFRIQVTGKNIFPIVSLKDLYKPEIISNFSKNDQKVIEHYVSNDCFQIAKRIVARNYDKQRKLFLYTIEFFDPKLGKTRHKVLDSLSVLSNEIYFFDKEDADLIIFETKKKPN